MAVNQTDRTSGVTPGGAKSKILTPASTKIRRPIGHFSIFMLKYADRTHIYRGQQQSFSNDLSV